MPVARLPLFLTVTTFALFVTGNVLDWVTHDPQSAGDWGGGGSPALAAVSLALFTFDWLWVVSIGTISFCLIVYAGGRQVTGQSGALAVTLSTLLVAASSQPLRTRIRCAVDRGFSRGHYDAEAAAAGFSGRLRSQVDLDAVHRELLAVVHATVQPSHAELWLPTNSEERPWSASPSATT